MPEQSGEPGESRPLPPASAGVLCPFCGTSQPAAEVVASGQCKACRNRMDPMARIATHNAMGPWYVRDMSNPFAPGCSYETLAAMCVRGRVKLNSVVRGPTTQQFWRLAAHTPGVAVLLGQCHACAERVEMDAERCPSCEAMLRPQVAVGVGRFVSLDDRQLLGLPPVRMLPDSADADAVLDSLAAALGHAGTARAGTMEASRDGAGPPMRRGDGAEAGDAFRSRARLLGAGLLLAVVLLMGLSLWAVVLPAMGLRTGVEEITGLGRPRAGVSGAGSQGNQGHRGSQSDEAAPSSGTHGEARRSEGMALSDAEVPGTTDPEALGAPAVDLQAPADEGAAGGTAERGAFDAALPREAGERIRRLRDAALSGEMADFIALRDAIDDAAREVIGADGVDGAEFSVRLPQLAALLAWVREAIAERTALDQLGVP